MENKINIAELLKDCPKGMELDCTICNNRVTLEGVVGNGSTYPIRVIGKDGFHHMLTCSGGVYDNKDAKCVIFPKGKTTWEGFVPPIQFKDGDIIKTITNNEYLFYSIYKGIEDKNVLTYIDYVPDENKIISISGVLCLTDEITEQRFATEEEKQKLFDAIKAKGYKWNAETKTLEELITPKKFDITTLKPFDKVLVRNKSNEVWTANFYSHYDATSDKPFICVGWSEMNEYRYCIPYEVNNELLGTTNNTEEYGSR